MTSPSQELKAAADKLRALATTASTDGRDKPTARWHFKKRDDRSGYLYAESPDGPGVRLLLGGSSGPHGRGSHPGMRTRHGEYAAAMDPTVGLALADWLDSWVGIDFSEHAAMAGDLAHALAVARAINGSQP